MRSEHARAEDPPKLILLGRVGFVDFGVRSRMMMIENNIIKITYQQSDLRALNYICSIA